MKYKICKLKQIFQQEMNIPKYTFSVLLKNNLSNLLLGQLFLAIPVSCDKIKKNNATQLLYHNYVYSKVCC